MLPFSDIHFFLFAIFYVGLFWLLKYLVSDRYYAWVTFGVTLLYMTAYYSYTLPALAYALGSYLYIYFLSARINHKLIHAMVLILPMLLFKMQVQTSWIYFAGLSFVTFRAVQTCLDHTPGSRLSFVDYFNFLFFLPSLYIGPLDRFKRFTADTSRGFSNLTAERFMTGWQQMALGILYKFVIAECISRYWLNAPGHETRSFYALHEIYGYACFLFFDFAGYSAMACGMGAMLGVDVPFNFNKPFVAVNPPDFWHRWHASLTSWLTDYLFRPLYKWLNGFKQLKAYPMTKQNSAIAVTFFTMGCWNGFEPNFIYSGLLYALYSVVHNTYAIQCRKKDHDVFFGRLPARLVHYFSVVIMFNLVCLALYVFSGRYM